MNSDRRSNISSDDSLNLNDDFILPDEIDEIFNQRADFVNQETNSYLKLVKYHDIIESFRMKDMELLDICNNLCFDGSRTTVNKLFLSIFYLKKEIPQTSRRRNDFSTLNIFSSVFPANNLIQLTSKTYPSRRNLMRFITKAVADLCKPLSVMEVTVCKKGCQLFTPE